MNSTVLIQQFKDAFCIKADKKLWGPRWEDAQKWYQKKTSLAGVVSALERLRTDLTGDGQLKRENMEEVRKQIREVPDKKQRRYSGALEQLKSDLNKIVFPEKTVGAFQIGVNHEGKPGIIGNDGNQVCPEDKALYIYEVLNALERTAGESGVAFDGIEKLIQSILKDDKLKGGFRGTIWEEAIKFVKEKVVVQVGKDLGKLEQSGLVPKGYKLKGIEFTGSDFHKGGKQVLFLRLADEKGTEKKIVFKPSSLMVDSLLFGKGGVGEVLGDIPTYNIVPMTSDEKSPKDLGYGYMDFVDTEGGPSTAEDVTAVYISIAANMAMSYYAGLEDVHKDNVLILKKGLQVIDMEATTGVFDMEGNTMKGGFIDMQWKYAMNEGVQKKLWDLIGEKKLTGIPVAATVWDAMLKKFTAVLEKVASGENKAKLQELETALAKQSSRCVPLPTQSFQTQLIPLAQECGTLEAWRRTLDNDLGDKGTILTAARGMTTTPLSTVKNLLYTTGVFTALVRGDVPYYTRDLGSDVVRDEAGEEIKVPGFKKVGKSIALEMAGRRALGTGKVIALFTTQIKPQVEMSLNILQQCLTAMK